jgi:hypothetical protein
MRKLLLFLRLTRKQKTLLIIAFVYLLIFHVAVNCLSVSFILKVLRLSPLKSHEIPYDNNGNLKHITELAKLTKKAVNAIPFLNVRCLAQAFTLLLLTGSLRKYCALNIGVCLNPANYKLAAHAWVSCNERIVIGSEERQQYAHVVSFN